MSNADRDELVVSERGITVRKSLDTEQFQTLAVVFEIHSERDEPVLFRLIDDIPEAVPIEDVGFHPEYGSEHWSVADGAVVFERRMEPDEEYTTVFGIRELGIEDATGLLGDPRIEVAQAGSSEGVADADADIPGELEEIVSEGNSEVVRDVIAGDRETMPGMGEDDADGAEAEGTIDEDAIVDALEMGANDATAVAGDDGDAEGPAETGAEPEDLDLGDEPTSEAADAPETDAVPEEGIGGETDDDALAVEESADPAAEADETEGGAEPADAEPPTGAGGMDEVPAGGVARVLAKELRQGNVSSEDRELLRDELAFTEGSTEARISHLQARVSDLEAYGDALEAFLDENGTAQELLDELRGEIEALRDDVAGVEERVEEAGADVADLRSWVTDDLDDLEGRLEDLGAEVEEIKGGRERVAEVAGTVDGAIERLDGLEDDLDAVYDRVADTDELAEELEGLRNDLDRIDETAARLDDLEDDLGSMRSDLEEMAAFRENLLNAVGGGAGTAETDEE